MAAGRGPTGTCTAGLMGNRDAERAGYPTCLKACHPATDTGASPVPRIPPAPVRAGRPPEQEPGWRRIPQPVETPLQALTKPQKCLENQGSPGVLSGPVMLGPVVDWSWRPKG